MKIDKKIDNTVMKKGDNIIDNIIEKVIYCEFFITLWIKNRIIEGKKIRDMFDSFLKLIDILH